MLSKILVEIVLAKLQTLLLLPPIYQVLLSILHKMAKNTILVLLNVVSPMDLLVLNYLDVLDNLDKKIQILKISNLPI
jgi:hypothetical protein